MSIIDLIAEGMQLELLTPYRSVNVVKVTGRHFTVSPVDRDCFDGARVNGATAKIRRRHMASKLHPVQTIRLQVALDMRVGYPWSVRITPDTAVKVAKSTARNPYGDVEYVVRIAETTEPIGIVWRSGSEWRVAGLDPASFKTRKAAIQALVVFLSASDPAALVSWAADLERRGV